MIKFKRLDHVQICIPKGQEDNARQFYANIIGLTEIPKPKQLISNGGLWYQIADIQLHIGTEDDINKSKRHPAFEVANLEEAKQYLIQRGVTLKEEIQIPEQKRFSFIDPFNNRIELLQKNILNLKVMGFIKEPKGVDFIIQSKPLTEKDKKKISRYITDYKARHKKKVRKLKYKSVIARSIATKQSFYPPLKRGQGDFTKRLLLPNPDSYREVSQ